MAKGHVCLAYSGGLDTSVILVWLIEQGYEVTCFLADVGQDEPWDEVRAKAKKLGARKMVIVDLKREFVDEFITPAIACNAAYQGRYLLGTSLARAPIARAQVKVAKAEGAQYLSHGCTGKGNDGVRFELAFLALEPTIKIIAPWREPDFYNRFRGRSDLLAYAAEKGIPVTSTKAKPWSMDSNAAHCSYEAGILEDPAVPAPDDIWTMTNDPFTAPDKPQDLALIFKEGRAAALLYDGKKLTDSVEIFLALNALGKVHSIGRIDIVEDRFIGLKSRGCYDAPAMTILRQAHLDAECLTLDGRVISLRNQFVTHTWTELLYNGLYFSPEREFVENSLHFSQKHVNAEVQLRLYKGQVIIRGRSSDTENLYSEEDASMDQLDTFSPLDTTGFIHTQAIRLKKYGQQKQAEGKPLTG